MSKLMKADQTLMSRNIPIMTVNRGDISTEAATVDESEVTRAQETDATNVLSQKRLRNRLAQRKYSQSLPECHLSRRRANWKQGRISNNASRIWNDVLQMVQNVEMYRSKLSLSLLVTERYLSLLSISLAHQQPRICPCLLTHRWRQMDTIKVQDWVHLNQV